jgi:putative nucleotidyltransferase with HDIG domain
MAFIRKLREWLTRDGGGRDGRGSPRAGAKGSAQAEAGARDRSWTWLAGSGAVLLGLHLSLFPPVPRLATDFPAVGEIAEREIRAPFSFEAPLLDRDVQMLRLERVVVEPPVLRRVSPAQGQTAGGRMEVWLEVLGEALRDTQQTVEEKVGLLALQFPALRPNDVRRVLDTAQPDSLVPRLSAALGRVMAGGVADMLPAGRYDRVVILDGQNESLRELDRVVAQGDVAERLTAELRTAGLSTIEAVKVAEVARHFVSPNLVYASTETRQRQDLARQAVPTSREFIRGERIVDQGVRVTEQQDLYLDELRTRLLARGGGTEGPGRAVRFFVRGVLVALALGLFGWLARIHFPEKLGSLRFLIATTVIYAVFLVGASFALNTPRLGPMAVPIVLLSLLSTVLFKGRIGYTTTLMAVIMLAVLPGVPAAAVFAWFVLGMVTVLSVRRIQKRSQFYQTILLLTSLSVVLIFLLGTAALGEGTTTGGLYLVGVFAPVLYVAFGLFLLPVVEPLVGVCSDLTLLELSDLNHPLLQRMALEAQGTYHHSQVVGQLGEHAARAVDANALLVRVGALFHDIGKMQKSEYYVENQNREYNKHDELSPSMSALVIASHVKDGIELGRKWRLPRQVIDFIPEHHGTMVMEYFYHKALEAEENETVKVDDFRYPGPKPRSRETAILMLADAVEAATRSLAKPTPSRIREVTKQIIDKRMLSGEMDESGLTLSDLARIREAFIPLLTGIHHARIVYPGQRERDADRALERKGDRKARS